MTAPLDEETLNADLGQMNLVVVPISYKLLREKNRAMQVDIAYAKENNIPILPLMMENGIDTLYSMEENFGERQYLTPEVKGTSSESYKGKLKNYLDTILVSGEMADRIRAAFDAYVFLSYRKKDRKYADELMRIIHAIPRCRDIAIWYDEFLTPGESFVSNIESAMDNSRLFALLVTPNILEEDNYVLREEYPAARRKGMDILPTEMVNTDRERLFALFDGIPSPIMTEDKEFSASFIGMLEKIAKSENDNDPEHNFLIGLAYLDGIDMEVDRPRALQLIENSANEGLPEAMEKMYSLYYEGKGVSKNCSKAAIWAKRLYEMNANQFGNESEEAITWLQKTGNALNEAGDFNEAYEYLRSAYEISLKLHGKIHVKTLNILENAINALRFVKRPDPATDYNYEAYRLSERLFDQRVKLLGEDHPDTIEAANLVGVCLESTKWSTSDRENVYNWYDYAYSQAVKLYGENHQKPLVIKFNFAYSVWRNGWLLNLRLPEHVNGLKTMEEVLLLAKEHLGEKHEQTINFFYAYGHCLAKSKRYKEAIPLLCQYKDLCREIYGAESDLYVSALVALYEVCSKGRKYKMALELLNTIDDIHVSLFGRPSENQSEFAFLYFMTGHFIKAIRAMKEAKRVKKENKEEKQK